MFWLKAYIGVVIVGLSLALFGACSPKPPQTKLILTPDILPYSEGVQEHAADELQKLGPPCPRDAVFGGCSAISRFVIDYRYMRQQTRKLRK